MIVEERPATDVAMAMAMARGNPSGGSIAEPSTDLHEMIEDEESDSATEEDPAALGSGNTIFKLPKHTPNIHLRAHVKITTI